jgi:hypothetical protein
MSEKVLAAVFEVLKATGHSNALEQAMLMQLLGIIKYFKC